MKHGRIAKIIRIMYITTETTFKGEVLSRPIVNLFAPYTSTEGWFIGTYTVPRKHIFSLRSMFKTR